MAKMIFCDIEIKQRYMIAFGLDSPHLPEVFLSPTSCYYQHFIVFRLVLRISLHKRNLRSILLGISVISRYLII